ncbi:MAG: hypothetical protein ACPL3P_06705 [Anaerolineales bacterium]
MSLSDSGQIGEIIQNAHTFNPRNWQGNPMTSNPLISSAQKFFEILEQRQIKYILAGGIALLYYIEGRNTQDINLLMAISALEKLPELEIYDQDMYFVRAKYNELHIDILLTQNPLFKKIYDQYSKEVVLLNHQISIATIEGLLLLKLYALPSLYRQGNFARVAIHENDIAVLIYYYKPNIESLLTELVSYLSNTDLAEIKNILAEIQTRTQRFEKRNHP